MKCFILLFMICQMVMALEDFDSPTNFKNLASRISDSQKQKIKNFDSSLKRANEYDDFYAQIYLAKSIYRQLDIRNLGIELVRWIYAKYGVDKAELAKNLVLTYLYKDIAQDYMKGKNTVAEPLTGIEILLKLAHATEDKNIKFDVGYFLAYSNYFPSAQYLVDAWRNDKTGAKKQSIDQVIMAYEKSIGSYVDEESEIFPDKKLFEACKNKFNKDERLLKKFQQLQDKLLSDEVVTDEELKQARKQLGDGVEVSFVFKGIKAINLLSLLLDVMGSTDDKIYKTLPNDELKDVYVDLLAKDMPAHLVYQKLLDSLNLDVKCHKEWVSISLKNTKNKVLNRFFFVNFMTKKELLTHNKVRISWGNGVSYEGGFSDAQFSGKGKFVFKKDNGKIYRIVEGLFNQGLLNGMGKDYFIDGSYSYEGGFRHGLFHGQGKLVDGLQNDSIMGQFVNGELIDNQLRELFFIRDYEKINDAYNQSISLAEAKKNLINFIKYKGPITEGIAHGKGHCYLQELDYDCEFYKGYLIGLEDFSILPDYIKIQ